MTPRDCFLCGKKGIPYAHVEKHDYLKCPGCGLVYVDFIEPPDKLYRSYDGGFLKSLRRKMFMGLRSFEGARHFGESMERARKIFSAIAANAAPSAHRFLDIGCNKGFLLAAAIEKGWDVSGIELVPELTLPFKNRYPPFASQVHSMGFGEAYSKLRLGSFDAISAIDVIEHFEDPKRELARIFELLAPDGLLLIQTPDTQDPASMEKRGNWGALKPREHLHLFSRHNLERFAKEQGFREMRVIEAFDPEDGNLSAVLKK